VVIFFPWLAIVLFTSWTHTGSFHSSNTRCSQKLWLSYLSYWVTYTFAT